MESDSFQRLLLRAREAAAVGRRLEAVRALGEPAQAVEIAQHARDLAAQVPGPGRPAAEALARSSLARLLNGAGRTEEAIHVLTQALDALGRHDVPGQPFMPFELTLARALYMRKVGRRDEARRELAGIIGD